jgi:hypothetical protein
MALSADRATTASYAVARRGRTTSSTARSRAEKSRLDRKSPRPMRTDGGVARFSASRYSPPIGWNSSW